MTPELNSPTQEVYVQTPEAPEAPALPARKVTRKNLARVQEQHLLANIDPLLRDLFIALTAKVKEKNIQAIRLTMEMANLVKAPGGVTISQTIMQNNSNAADGGLVADVGRAQAAGGQPAEMPARLIAYATRAFGEPPRPATVPGPKAESAMKTKTSIPS